jgi:hypothetical protein
MNRPLVIMLISGITFLVLETLSVLQPNFGGGTGKELTEHLLPHAIVAVAVIFLAALVTWFLGEQIERFEPIIERAFGRISSDARAGIETSLQKISGDLRAGIEGSMLPLNTTIATGLNGIATALAEEFSDSLKGLSSVTVRQDLISSVQSEEVRELAAAGETRKAVKQLNQMEENAGLRPEQVKLLQDRIAVLILSHEITDWLEALVLLIQNKELQAPKYYITLAYNFWSVKQLDRAIDLAEKGLALAVQVKDEKRILRFENSLAYYYADAEKMEKEELARKYAEEAVSRRPDDTAPLDTLGFVKITYGKTREEILDGAKMCTKALEKGAEFELYAKHVARANMRLKQFSPPAPDQVHNTAKS